MDFKDTPLKVVVQAIADVYGVNFSIKNEDAEEIANIGQTIHFKDQTLESVIKELETITSYQVKKIDDNHYEISIR